MKIEFEISILTVASMVSYKISTVKIGISGRADVDLRWLRTVHIWLHYENL